MLHNYLLENSPRTYAPPGTVDQEDKDGNVANGFWREEFDPAGTLFNISRQSKQPPFDVSKGYSKGIC